MTSQRLMCRLVALLGIGVGVLAAPALAQDCPELVGQLPYYGRATAVAVSGAYAYVAAHDGVLRVVDVSNPAAPVEVGFYDTPGSVFGVAVAGGHVYLAAYDAGLYVFRECGAVVFTDGFESGDTSAWSATVP